TLSTVIFLVSFDTPLAAADVLNLAAQGRWGRPCAVATALLVATFAGLGLAYLLTGGRLRGIDAAGRVGACRGRQPPRASATRRTRRTPTGPAPPAASCCAG